jgi:hypothetical protein
VPAVGIVALVGMTLSKTEKAATIVSPAEADLVGSATLVAFTVTVADEGALAGVTYSPLLEIVPHAAPVQPVPLTVQITVVFDVPVTFPINCRLFPTITVALFGFTVIAIGALTVRLAALLVTPPAVLLTVTVNWLPLSEIAAAEVVKVAEVAPVIALPFFCHW